MSGGSKTTPSVVPVFLDVQVPLPGQVVVFVVVGELGLDDVVPSSQHAFGRLLHVGQEVVLGGAGAVAAHHVVRFINCTETETGGVSLQTVFTGDRQLLPPQTRSLTFHSFPEGLLNILQSRDDLLVHLTTFSILQIKNHLKTIFKKSTGLTLKLIFILYSTPSFSTNACFLKASRSPGK